MANTPSHVIPRDGSVKGGPPPAPPEVPKIAPSKEAETGIAQFGGSYGDASTVGHFDARRQFEAAHGAPSPRQRVARGDLKITPSEKRGPFPAPLD